MEDLDKKLEFSASIGKIGLITLQNMVSFLKGDLPEASFGRHIEPAKKELIAYGEDPKQWEGREVQMCAYLTSHFNLGIFRLAEDTEGIKRTESLMKEAGISYNPKLELLIREKYSSDYKKMEKLLRSKGFNIIFGS